MTKTAEQAAAEVADLIDKATATLIRRGHTKDYLERRLTGRVCALGALNHAYSGSTDFPFSPRAGRCADDSTYELARAAIAAHANLGSERNAIANWNNAKSTRKRDIVRTFREVSAALRSTSPEQHVVVDVETRSQRPVDEPATTVAVFDPRWVIDAPEGAVRTVVEVVS